MAKRKVKIILGSLVVLIAIAAAVVFQFIPATEPTVTLGGKTYSVAETDVGSLLGYAEAREILERHIPGIGDIRQLDVARPLTLIDIQPYYPELITSDKLAAIDAELRDLKVSGVVMYTTGSTQVGVILDDPDARAIVDKHLPGFSTNPDIDQGRGFTLNFMQKFDRDTITEEVLAGINADFEELARARAEAQ